MFFVKIVSGKFSALIDDNLHSDTILQLKQSINKHHKIPINLLKLSYNGTLLEDNKKISDYFIQSNDKIDLDLNLIELNLIKNGTYNLKWYVEEGVSMNELQKRLRDAIIRINPNHILKDGDNIILV